MIKNSREKGGGQCSDSGCSYREDERREEAGCAGGLRIRARKLTGLTGSVLLPSVLLNSLMVECEQPFTESELYGSPTAVFGRE